MFAGIDVGPLVAGVVGSKKPMYDIWGDTVNMASRLDYTGVPGRIHVTERVFNRLRIAGMTAEFRGLTTIKGKNQPLPTYFVEPGSVTSAIALERRKKELQDAAFAKEQGYNRSMSTLGAGAGKKFFQVRYVLNCIKTACLPQDTMRKI